MKLARRRLHRTVIIGAAAMTVLVPAFGGVLTPSAGADTDPTALVGEGGSFLAPVTDLLLKADTGLAPLNPSYSDNNLDSAVADFVGTGPGQFAADFVVSERPLTTAETATATADGRTFAYVPFAATPVAIATLDVCDSTQLNDPYTASSTTFCKDIPLTTQLVAGLFTNGLTSPGVTPNTGLPPELGSWNNPLLTQAGGAAIPDDEGIGQASTLLPSAENSALMAYLDSDPTARLELDNALNNPAAHASTTSDAPSEIWPFHGGHAYVGGDEGLLESELSINAATNAPQAPFFWGGLGGTTGNAHDVFPVSAVWTGAPLGTPWNVPTAAIQNAAQTYVAPTEAAAAASEADATLGPTNLVTFNPSTTDSAAYNNYLMVESYLVVPTSGLTAQKATKLAQFIRFAVGPTAQADETTLGAAPPTPAMVTADLKVAGELDAEATAAAPATTTTTTTTTTAPSTTTTTIPAGSAGGSSGGAIPPAASAGSGAGGSSGGSSNVLAFTGTSDLAPLVGIGASLVVLGALFRRRFRRREARS